MGGQHDRWGIIALGPLCPQSGQWIAPELGNIDHQDIGRRSIFLGRPGDNARWFQNPIDDVLSVAGDIRNHQDFWR